MKRSFLSFILLFIISSTIAYSANFEDDFSHLLQILAIRTACVGSYSATQAGGYNIDDPHDYYTPAMIADLLKEESGLKTKTDTFYGICFDYAQCAWDYIKLNQELFNSLGMKKQEWYIVVTKDNSNTIMLYDPISEQFRQYDGSKTYDIRDNTPLEKWNGVYCKKNREFNIKSHTTLYDKTKRATNHAWIWIQRDNDQWYWVDPTWTDNTGYIVWGYVDMIKGEEISLISRDRYSFYTSPIPETPKQEAPKQETSKQDYSNSTPSTNYYQQPTNTQPSVFTFNIDTGLVFSTKNHFGLSAGFEIGKDYLTALLIGVYNLSGPNPQFPIIGIGFGDKHYSLCLLVSALQFTESSPYTGMLGASFRLLFDNPSNILFGFRAGCLAGIDLLKLTSGDNGNAVAFSFLMTFNIGLL